MRCKQLRKQLGAARGGAEGGVLRRGMGGMGPRAGLGLSGDAAGLQGGRRAPVQRGRASYQVAMPCPVLTYARGAASYQLAMPCPVRTYAHTTR
eukprot:2984544-Rhodomonas_salina.4